MSKKIVAIGGGENGRLLENGEYAPYNTRAIDEEIINLTGKEKPNFLFLAHSMASSLEIQESYYQTMKKIYGEKFGCNCLDLKSNELDDFDKVRERIEWADIIYEGGGDTAIMISLWKDKGFDKVLYEAWNNGKVICGISAGAVCWFTSCNSDSLNGQVGAVDSFESVDCLGWFRAHFTPHCDEAGRYESSKRQLLENGLIGIMLSNGAALEIIDNNYRLIIDDTLRDAYGIIAWWDNSMYYENKIDLSPSFKPLPDLLGKNVRFKKK